MGLNSTPSSERVHIAFFGKRNVGKSSLVNAVLGQTLSVVSDVAGTTTDPVFKAMELLPLGPVKIIDTPGIDDEGVLGELRIKKTYEILSKTDIAVLTVDERGLLTTDLELIDLFRQKNISYIIAHNKADLFTPVGLQDNEIAISSITGENIAELKEKIAAFSAKPTKKSLIPDLVLPNDTVILVTPIDSASPKGRLILPQQQTIRALLDKNACIIVLQETELDNFLLSSGIIPKLVICDSRVFKAVNEILPQSIPLTSFSILFARYKGDLIKVFENVKALDKLKDNDTVLISEGCTHHRQCDDIGTVKLPKLILAYTGKNINFEHSQGCTMSEDISKYKMLIHCGGCMLSEREMKSRISLAEKISIPITNYGLAIAYMNGILQRSTSVFDELKNI